MDKRVRVYDLDRRGEQRGVPCTARGSIGGEKEYSAKALAAAEQTVSNRGGHARGMRFQWSEAVTGEMREGVVDSMPIRLDLADDAGVEHVGAAALSHENR